MSKVENRLPGTPSWFDVMTPDLEGAKKFYGELFGWSIEIGPAEMGYYSNCQLRGMQVAGMGKLPENAPFPSAWSCYFHTTDVNRSVALVKEFGGQVTMGPMAVMDFGHMAVCSDPTGAIFGFWQPGTHRGSLLENEPGAMCWAELYTRQAAKARDFYSKVLEVEARPMEGGDIEYYTFHKGEPASSGCMQMDEKFPAQVPAHWNVYFAVADADASAERIKALGGKVFRGPFDTPYGRMASVADPYGAAFSIIALPKSMS